jgi:hypothetical protein
MSLKTLVSVLFLILGLGCTTPESVKQVDQQEVKRWNDSFENEIAVQFESQLHLKKETDVSVYLNEVAQLLVNATPEFKKAPVGVLLLQNKKHKWESYGIPGIRLYISTGLLKSVEYENELAGLMAIQLGNVMNKNIIHRLIALRGADNYGESSFDRIMLTSPHDLTQKMDYFGPNGLFSFIEEDILAGARKAVGILYHAGYDARGLLLIYDRFLENPNFSPYEKRTLVKLKESVRHEIAMHAPLRNPIVRSQGFLLIQKRIKRL